MSNNEGTNFNEVTHILTLLLSQHVVSLKFHSTTYFLTLVIKYFIASATIDLHIGESSLTRRLATGMKKYVAILQRVVW